MSMVETANGEDEEEEESYKLGNYWLDAKVQTEFLMLNIEVYLGLVL